jgi:hypothetical protein
VIGSGGDLGKGLAVLNTDEMALDFDDVVGFQGA